MEQVGNRRRSQGRDKANGGKGGCRRGSSSDISDKGSLWGASCGALWSDPYTPRSKVLQAVYQERRDHGTDWGAIHEASEWDQGTSWGAIHEAREWGATSRGLRDASSTSLNGNDGANYLLSHPPIPFLPLLPYSIFQLLNL